LGCADWVESYSLMWCIGFRLAHDDVRRPTSASRSIWWFFKTATTHRYDVIVARRSRSRWLHFRSAWPPSAAKRRLLLRPVLLVHRLGVNATFKHERLAVRGQLPGDVPIGCFLESGNSASAAAELFIVIWRSSTSPIIIINVVIVVVGLSLRLTAVLSATYIPISTMKQSQCTACEIVVIRPTRTGDRSNKMVALK